MKKLLLITGLLCCMLICSCASDSDEGVGIPKIDDSYSRSSIRMVRTADGLYYDTGAECENMPTCGTLSGHLTKDVSEYEIPTKDYSTNFDGASGYQTNTEDTIQLPLDDTWIIFRKVEADRDLSGYKYCTYLKEEGKISEYIAFTKDKESEDAFLLPVKYGIVYDWGIELSTENVTPAGLTLVCHQSGGNPKGSLQTGSWYALQKYNGRWWSPVEYIETDGDIAWTMEAYLIPKNDEVKWDVEWEWLYGELEPGEYRIAKQIDDYTGSGATDSYTYYANFTIEN